MIRNPPKPAICLLRTVAMAALARAFGIWWMVALLAILGAGCGRGFEKDRPVLSLKEMSREQRFIFLKGYRGDWRGSADKNRGIPPPPIEKSWPVGVQLISLPDPTGGITRAISVVDAITKRRSRRAYTEQPLTLGELSWLLWCTQGIEKVDRDKDGNVIANYRTVPSAGARHPFETYLSVHRVEGLNPGIYRYLPVEHKLLPIRYDGGMALDFMAACYNQEHVAKSAVLFIWAAVPYRTEWAYGFIAAKLVAVDAGHVCQNLYLGAEAVGIGVCAILGYDQQRMDSLLCLDGREEFVIYAATAGRLPPSSVGQEAGGMSSHETF